MSTFPLGPGCRVDLGVLTDTRMLIQANSGGGKSWALRYLLEQTHGKLQHLVIDPEGEFASLRERFDYVHAAKQGGDTAADPRSAKLLAERLLQLGVSAILDIYELKAHERIRFVRHFLDALVDAPKAMWHPALVVVDEAHVFCPQKGEAESAGSVIDLATRGRKRGFCAVLATQRLSKLHKDAAAELNNKLIGRTGLDVDMARAAEELGFSTREDRLSLRTLEPGTFFAFGPALSAEVRRVTIGEVKTTHPKAGSRIAFSAPPPTSKIRALLPQLADLPAEQEQRERSEADLKKEITDLKRRLTTAERGRPLEAKPVEVPAVSAEVLQRLERVGERFLDAVGDLREIHAGAFDEVKGVLEQARAIAARRPVPRSTDQRHAPRPIARSLRPAGPASDAISPARQKILNALAFLEEIGVAPADKTQLALFVGASPTSGGYFNNLGGLRSAGLIEYPTGGMVGLTEDGRSIAVVENVPTTTEELHRAIRGKLPPAKWKVLEALISAYPDSISKDELAQTIGVSPTSGGYFNNLGSLRSLGLIDYPRPSEVIARPVLFVGNA